jgi:hypothetical protein
MSSVVIYCQVCPKEIKRGKEVESQYLKRTTCSNKCSMILKERRDAAINHAGIALHAAIHSWHRHPSQNEQQSQRKAL